MYGVKEESQTYNEVPSMVFFFNFRNLNFRKSNVSGT